MKENINNKTFIALFAVLILIGLVFLPEVHAQCPMCRIAAESNLENGGNAGKGLNNGIFYLLAAPYLIVGFIGYMWWKNRRTDEVID